MTMRKGRTRPRTRRPRAALFLPLLLLATAGAAQGVNNLWMGGYSSGNGPPFGGVDMEFGSGAVVVSYAPRDIDLRRTNTNITDGQGESLFSTNGVHVANATGFPMQNGLGLSPSAYTSQYPNGLYICQAVMTLPAPGAEGIYYLFHGTIDTPNPATAVATRLYVSTIDMSLDGGLGGVVTKNQVVINDSLNVGKITAVRHANGRDWWVFCHEPDNDVFHRLLVTPEGITVDGTQNIGVVRQPDAGQVCFSPDGTRFAYYWGYLSDLDIFRFDRCTGLFYDPVHIEIDDTNGSGGVAFSPNSRYLYVPSVMDVYQFDTDAADIAASMVHIAEWDGYYSPQPPFATLFDPAQLAPDGKVYIGTGNGTLHYHVIHDPDQPGTACDLEQHGVELPAYCFNSLPNHPNYHLGALTGSPCDTLGLSLGAEAWAADGAVSAYPNPSGGEFNVSYRAQPVAGTLEVRDVEGRIVYRQRLPQWSTVHRVALNNMAAGLYQCTLRWGTTATTTRVIITEP